MSTIPEITLILDRCIQGTATEAELLAFYEWAELPENREQATQLLEKKFAASDGSLDVDPATFESMIGSILDASPQNQPVHLLPKKQSIYKLNWLRYAAAIIIFAGAATYLWRINSSTHTESNHNLSAVQSQQLDAETPTNAGAVLTLADGSTILLDSAANEQLAQQQITNVTALESGQIAYKAVANTQQTEPVYNTIATPKGRQFQITLADGSKVWLNASSSIKFPTSFNQQQRSVTITGEAYLEIAADINKPFYVNTDEVTIQVLGTSFNINTYPDEATVNTTLLEGSLKVIPKNSQQPTEIVLTPGQQSKVNQQGAIHLVQHANTAQVMAWKNGAFRFQDKTLEEVMRELSRWYDIEVVYENGVPEIEFGGEMGRNLKLGQMLKSLGGAGLNFRMEKGRRLVILP